MKSISAEVVFNHMTPEALVDFMVSLAGDTNLCNELYSRAGLKLIASVGKKEADRLLAVAQMKAIRWAMAYIEEAAKVAGPSGISPDVVYNALSEHGMTPGVFQQILCAMIRAGKITADYRAIKLV